VNVDLLISRWRRKADTDNNRGDFEADELTDELHRADVANVRQDGELNGENDDFHPS
jgi:hypothetical protein